MDASSNNTYSNLPAPSKIFKDRKEKIEDIRFQLDDRRAPTILLWGEAGVGKTSLALHLAHTLLSEGNCHAIVWTTAKSYEVDIADPFNRTFLNKPINQYSQRKRRTKEGVFVESLLQLYQKLLMSSGFFEEHNVDELKHIWNDEKRLEIRVLAWMKARRIVLFLDDLDSWEKRNWRYVKKFVGRISFPSSVVITSRRNIDALSIPGIAPIPIGSLDKTALIEIINDYSEAYGLKLDGEEAESIAKFSGGSPLTLNLILGLIEIRSKNWLGYNKRISSEILDEIVDTVSSSKPLEEFLFRDLFDNLESRSQSVIFAIAALKQCQQKVTRTVIKKLTNLEDDGLQTALTELQAVSLLNRTQSDLDDFDIHSMVFDYLYRRDKKLMTVMLQYTKTLFNIE